jgi:hypothetical protein
MIICIRELTPNDFTDGLEPPNTLTWLRIFAIRWSSCCSIYPFTVGGSGRGPAVRRPRHHRLARWLSRARMGQTSRLGAFLDPVATSSSSPWRCAAREQGDAARSSCPGSKAWTAATRRCARRR